MALENAEITVQFTAQWTGDHRVCYRVVGDPTYICTIPGSLSGDPGIHTYCAAGNTCQYNIPIQVDNETCDQVNYEGYVQAFCEDVESPAGRIPFVISFIPDPTCKRYEVTCDNVPVLDATINNGGTGYINGSYTNVPVVGGGGSNAEFTVDISGGVITTLTLTNPGSGYISVPTLDLVGAGINTGGTVAIITVNLDNCANDLRVYDCSNNFTTVPGGTIALGESIFECYGVGTPPEVATGFVRSEQDGNCLCNCIEQDIQNTFDGGSIDYNYIDCNGEAQSGTLAALGTTGNICMVDGSLITVVNSPAVLNVSVVGPCDAVAP
jgi:hypothetical protein